MPTAEEMQQPYIYDFWVWPGEMEYVGPPAVQTEPHQYTASTSAQQSNT